MRIGMLSDLHLRQPGLSPDGWHNPHQFETARERLATALDLLGQEGVEAIAVLGDLTHDGDEATFHDVLEILATAPVPVWIVPGNHDLMPDTSVLVRALAGYTGSPMLLSGESLLFMGGWQVLGCGLTRTPDGYLVEPGPLLQTLDDPALVLSHFPLLSLRTQASAASLQYAGDPLNGAAVVAELTNRAVPVLVFSGHLHIRHAQAQGPVLQASCGAQVESLFEMTVLDLSAWSEGMVSWQATSVAPVWPGVEPALSDAHQTWRWDGDHWLSVAT
jgi:hypothetical protein